MTDFFESRVRGKKIYTRKENIILRKYFKEFCWLLRNAADWLTDNQNRHSFSIEISNKTPSTDKTFFFISVSWWHHMFTSIYFDKALCVLYFFLANAPNYIGSFSLFYYSVCVCLCLLLCLSMLLLCLSLSLAASFSFYFICVSSIPFLSAIKCSSKDSFFYCSRQYMGNSKRKFDKKLVTLIK